MSLFVSLALQAPDYEARASSSNPVAPTLILTTEDTENTEVDNSSKSTPVGSSAVVDGGAVDRKGLVSAVLKPGRDDPISLMLRFAHKLFHLRQRHVLVRDLQGSLNGF